MIIRYNRRKDNTKNGVFVARVHDGRVVIGWSKCHSQLDRFNREHGVFLANARIDVASERNRLMPANEEHVPHSMRVTFNRLVESCMKYFKTDDIYVVSASTPSRSKNCGADCPVCEVPCFGCGEEISHPGDILNYSFSDYHSVNLAK